MTPREQGWQIGMTAFVVFERRNGNPATMIVTKIGRKWVTLGEGCRVLRFDPETMGVDGNGHSSPGRVYISEDAWREQDEVQQAWRAFYRSLGYQPPKGMTMATLDAVIAWIGAAK